ncbi:MAG: alpha/beta fold hydrolase [Moraxellaceae bacterium]|nr:alpha/beta fold hydrolase [Moraxellaceae bacterium]
MQLIDAPEGVLEIETLWQNDNLNDPNTDTVALLCHPNPLHGGTMTNKVVSTMWRFARDTGYHVVRFNFRGVGQSTGTHDYAKGEVIDGLTVLQWIAEHSNAEKLWLGGFSFGGYVTARIAEQLTLSPHVWGLDFEIAKIALIAPSVVNNDTTHLTLPTEKCFVIYGDNDEVVNPTAINEFAQRMQIDYQIMEGAGHFFHKRLGDLKGLLEAYSSSDTFL